MNTRRFNLAATARSTSGHKRRRTTQTSHHERAPIDDDFDTIRWRDETLDSRKRVLTTTTERESSTNDTWSSGDSWLPEDSTEFGLDDEPAWFDDDEDGTVHIEIEPPLQTAGGNKKRSIVSVSVSVHHQYSNSDPPIESTARSMDAEAPRHVFGRAHSLGRSGGLLLGWAR